MAIVFFPRETNFGMNQKKKKIIIISCYVEFSTFQHFLFFVLYFYGRIETTLNGILFVLFDELPVAVW